MREIERADNTNSLNVDSLILEYPVQIVKSDDCRIRIFFLRHHKRFKTVIFRDCACILCEGRRLRSSKKNRICLVCKYHDRFLLKLRAPSGQIPAVRHVQFVIINNCTVQVFLTENPLYFFHSAFCLLKIIVCHFLPP